MITFLLKSFLLKDTKVEISELAVVFLVSLNKINSFYRIVNL